MSTIHIGAIINNQENVITNLREQVKSMIRTSKSQLFEEMQEIEAVKQRIYNLLHVINSLETRGLINPSISLADTNIPTMNVSLYNEAVAEPQEELNTSLPETNSSTIPEVTVNNEAVAEPQEESNTSLPESNSSTMPKVTVYNEASAEPQEELNTSLPESNSSTMSDVTINESDIKIRPNSEDVESSTFVEDLSKIKDIPFLYSRPAFNFEPTPLPKSNCVVSADDWY